MALIIDPDASFRTREPIRISSNPQDKGYIANPDIVEIVTLDGIEISDGVLMADEAEGVVCIHQRDSLNDIIINDDDTLAITHLQGRVEIHFRDGYDHTDIMRTQ